MMTGEKSITEFLLERTLDLYGGNKRLLARRLQIGHLDVYRWIKRFREGGLSATALEALLKMYARENMSIDKVLQDYRGHIETFDQWTSTNPCACSNDEYMQRVYALHESMEIAKPQNDAKHMLLNLAIDLMTHLEQMFCERARNSKCIFCSPGCCACPCRNFGIFIDRLVSVIDEQMLAQPLLGDAVADENTRIDS